MHSDEGSPYQLTSSCRRNVLRLSFQRFACSCSLFDYKSLKAYKCLRKPPLSSSPKMRRRFLGFLLTCVIFGANASDIACPKSHLHQALAASTVEEASIACFSGQTSTSNLSALSKRTASAPLRPTKTSSFPTKHEDEAADASPSSLTSEAMEGGRPSVAKRDRDEGRSLRQDDSQDNEALASETNR